MTKECQLCSLIYDDAYKYTSCPHMPIGAGPAPFHPTTNPSGYCKEHDLFACEMPKHAAFRLYDNWRDGFMPADKQAPIEGRPGHGCGGVPPLHGRAPDVVGPTAPAEMAGRRDPDFYRPKTLGIPPAKEGPLQVLQFATPRTNREDYVKVREAALEIARVPEETGDSALRHDALEYATAAFLVEIVSNCQPGPERSTAISRAREAQAWASEAINRE